MAHMGPLSEVVGRGGERERVHTWGSPFIRIRGVGYLWFHGFTNFV